MAGDRNECCSLRADIWLWRARFFKTRTLAAEMIGKGRLRRNGQPRDQSRRVCLRQGDVLIFPQAGRVRADPRCRTRSTRRGPGRRGRGALHPDLDIDTAAPAGPCRAPDRGASGTQIDPAASHRA
jgi:ribosome-associated heat shock protein Hsp15